MRYTALTLICTLGFAIGMVGHAYLIPSLPRADRIYHLFSEICLAGESPDTLGLAPRSLHAPEARWIDAKSASYVTRRPDACSVQIDESQGLNDEDASHLVHVLQLRISSDFPDPALDPKASLGPQTLSKAWMTGAPRTAHRWGISFYVFRYLNGSATLTYHRPKDA
jgi:hypothetical protein